MVPREDPVKKESAVYQKISRKKKKKQGVGKRKAGRETPGGSKAWGEYLVKGVEMKRGPG